MDHPLKTPLTFGKTTISKLTFRDFTTANDYLAFDNRGGVAQQIALIASLTGTDETIIGQLRGPDYLAAGAIADKMIAEDNASMRPKSEEPTGEADPEKKSQES